MFGFVLRRCAATCGAFVHMLRFVFLDNAFPPAVRTRQGNLLRCVQWTFVERSPIVLACCNICIMQEVRLTMLSACRIGVVGFLS